MRSLARRAPAIVLALCALEATLVLAPAPAAAQDGYYYRRSYESEPRYDRIYRERRYDERRVYERDTDARFEQRMRYYRRDAIARRQAQERGRGYEEPREPRRRPAAVPFLQRLFGGPEPELEDEGWTARRDPGAVEVRPKPRVRRKRPPEAAAPPAVAAPVVKPATPPTAIVAVFGDSIADGLAGGAAEAFADAPELGVKRYVKPNAGLVRTDYHDFAAAARTAVASDPITYAVVGVGVNDRQPFLEKRDAGPLSPEWRRRYVQRVDGLLEPFKEKNIPVYWVGLAPSEGVRASSDHTAINALVRERVEAAGGTYVDVWEGFVDEDGDYAAVGPQLDGQIVKLRVDDGVHFSKAGSRKLAHYVEQEIRKVFKPKPATTPEQTTSEQILSGLTPSDAQSEPAAPVPANRPRPLAGPLVVLTGPRAAVGGALLGGAPRPAPSPAEQVLVRGEVPAADPGRLDDHRWPGASTPPPARGFPPATAAAP